MVDICSRSGVRLLRSSTSQSPAPRSVFAIETLSMHLMLARWWYTHMSIIVFPNPYHRPPAPTRLASRTLRGSALSALRTLLPNGDGILKSAQSLVDRQRVMWTLQRIAYEYTMI